MNFLRPLLMATLGSLLLVVAACEISDPFWPQPLWRASGAAASS
jgi:hypothetical protein